ncbi:MAG: prolipoprotein diacylglyceryl transferase [Holosporales bacterium]|nr:prolipoprotein diacylglyceryl transferase [Holosporales bacterium]
MIVWNLSPIAFSLGGKIDVYWYGIIYALSVMISWKISCSIIRRAEIQINIPDFDKFMLVGIVACIIGARLGHIVFFDLNYYLQNPHEIFMLRNGGLSFHGGILGLIGTIIWFSRQYKIGFKIIADILSFAGSIGIFLGRIANFINQELYGKITSVDWAVIFSMVDNMPRHPTQLYEALFEGALSFVVMRAYWSFHGMRNTEKYIGSGKYSFIFLSIYSSSRYFIEFFKEVEPVESLSNVLFITTGQLLSVLLFIFALLVIVLPRKKR